MNPATYQLHASLLTSMRQAIETWDELLKRPGVELGGTGRALNAALLRLAKGAVRAYSTWLWMQPRQPGDSATTSR